MITRCALTELYTDQCAHCRGLALHQDRLGPWFEAMYVGRCADCDDGILPGDRIRARGDVDFLCEACGSTW